MWKKPAVVCAKTLSEWLTGGTKETRVGGLRSETRSQTPQCKANTLNTGPYDRISSVRNNSPIRISGPCLDWHRVSLWVVFERDGFQRELGGGGACWTQFFLSNSSFRTVTTYRLDNLGLACWLVGLFSQTSRWGSFCVHLVSYPCTVYWNTC